MILRCFSNAIFRTFSVLHICGSYSIYTIVWIIGKYFNLLCFLCVRVSVFIFTSCSVIKLKVTVGSISIPFPITFAGRYSDDMDDFNCVKSRQYFARDKCILLTTNLWIKVKYIQHQNDDRIVNYPKNCTEL